LVLAFLFMGTPPVRHSTINRKLPSAGGIIPPFLSCENAPFYYQQVSPLDAPAIRICALLLSGQAPESTQLPVGALNKRRASVWLQLWLILGDGVNQAADLASGATSIPS
jgi:hypothetical protein